MTIYFVNETKSNATFISFYQSINFYCNIFLHMHKFNLYMYISSSPCGGSGFGRSYESVVPSLILILCQLLMPNGQSICLLYKTVFYIRISIYAISFARYSVTWLVSASINHRLFFILTIIYLFIDILY